MQGIKSLLKVLISNYYNHIIKRAVAGEFHSPFSPLPQSHVVFETIVIILLQKSDFISLFMRNKHFDFISDGC